MIQPIGQHPVLKAREKFSFPLAEGLRSMPHKAKSLFEADGNSNSLRNPSGGPSNRLSGLPPDPRRDASRNDRKGDSRTTQHSEA
jgi:hypothetical protein